MKSKTYTGADYEVGWHPDVCTHSKVCWTNLRSVFDPSKRPWITLENSDRETIKKQVLACPSGALEWKENGHNAPPAEVSSAPLQIELAPNGPILVKGEFELIGSDGTPTPTKKTITALCRCGASGNKPFCDGSHHKIGFTA